MKSGKGLGCSRATFLYVYDQGGEYARVNIAVKRVVIGRTGITMRESDDDKCTYRFAEVLMPRYATEREARQRRSSKVHTITIASETRSLRHWCDLTVSVINAAGP